MADFGAQLQALAGLAAVPVEMTAALGEIEAAHEARLRRAEANERRALEQAEAVAALVERTLVASRAALQPVGMENAVPRKVRPARAPADPIAIARDAEEALGEAHDRLAASVDALARHRLAERDRRRQEFVDEEERRARAERDRVAAELRRKEEAERRAAEDARRRQLVIRAVLAGVVALVIILAILLS